MSKSEGDKGQLVAGPLRKVLFFAASLMIYDKDVYPLNFDTDSDPGHISAIFGS